MWMDSLTSPSPLEGLLPRSQRRCLPRRRQGPRAVPRGQGRARRAPVDGGAVQGAVRHPRQQDRPPGRGLGGRAPPPARHVPDDGQGQGAARGHPAHRGLHVLGGDEAGIRRRHPVALSVRVEDCWEVGALAAPASAGEASEASARLESAAAEQVRSGQTRGAKIRWG